MKIKSVKKAAAVAQGQIVCQACTRPYDQSLVLQMKQASERLHCQSNTGIVDIVAKCRLILTVEILRIG